MSNICGIPVEKDSIVFRLLKTTNPVPLSTNLINKISSTVTNLNSELMSSTVTASNSNSNLECTVEKKSNSNQAKALERAREIVAMDHCYARPLNWTADSAFFQPTKLILLSPSPKPKERKSTNPLAPIENYDEVIDIESVPPSPIERYDKEKALLTMDECNRHAVYARVNEGNENWEESISRVNWTPAQNRLFNGIVNILHSDRLARLAHTDAYHEPILRRTSVDKSVKRVRHLFATISWNSRLTQWLHQLLTDNLSTPYLGAYLDILQTLKSKLPTFVDKMMYGPNSSSRVGATSNESLFHLLKRPWDPFTNNTIQVKIRKLPGNPIIIIVPSSPSISNPNQLRRQHKWISLLSTLGTVVAVHTSMGNSANRLTMVSCADHMLTATRAKVQEVKADYPGRPIILVGFNVGAALALQVAQIEHVVCVVCLGFSVLTAEGRRGEPDDSLLELQCPVLFVIGQCSNTSLQEDIEELRERMRVENGLIVVGCADDYLRVNKKKKRAEGITQSAVDRLVVESVGEFISGLLLSPFPPQVRQSPIHGSSEIPPPKRLKIERKRNNSNGSSVDSEPPSPTPKISRPVGRPPGSKGKAKLEAKWAAHVTQGIPSPSSDTPLSLSSSSPLPQPLSEINCNSKTTKNKNNSVEAQSIIADSTFSSTDQQNKTNSAKMQALGLNRLVLTSGTALENMVQSGCKGSIPVFQPNKPNCNINVLENVTLNTNAPTKVFSSTANRPSDVCKLSLLNVNTSKSTPIVVMSDRKLKIGSSIRGTGNTPMLLPMFNKNKLSYQPQTQSMHRVAKYITSKKQLIGQKPPVPTMKPTIISSYSTNLPLPTNLTSQDIMDLPIIFADDNQMLTENSKFHAPDVSVSEIVQPSPNPIPKNVISNPIGKFVFINKQMPVSSVSLPVTLGNTNTTLKRPILTVPTCMANPQKYKTIRISRGAGLESKTSAANVLSTISNLSSEISIRKVGAPSPPTAPIPTKEDLENSIASTTIQKPDHHIAQIKDSTNQESESPEAHGSQMLVNSNLEGEEASDSKPSSKKSLINNSST
ncbi:hypothetical protein FQA39_LY08767 [Lamprigera yunnana]|nr:hypothetical protein FQA39_LY08767 [Lamprigera yunnana]